jgi:hypothetical protein
MSFAVHATQQMIRNDVATAVRAQPKRRRGDATMTARQACPSGTPATTNRNSEIE